MGNVLQSVVSVYLSVRLFARYLLKKAGLSGSAVCVSKDGNAVALYQSYHKMISGGIAFVTVLWCVPFSLCPLCSLFLCILLLLLLSIWYLNDDFIVGQMS